MKPLEIIIGAVVLLISIVLIVICMMQEQKPQNATAALTGASNDSFYDKNRGRTKEARLKSCALCVFRSGTALRRRIFLFSGDIFPFRSIRRSSPESEPVCV